MRRIEKKRRQAALGTEADPVMLEVFNNLFMSIAEQMGVTLQNTAYSVNIKERLDFSCAVFDRNGALVANAPHMPVHLGSMDRSVETIIRLNEGDIHPGDVFALNAPYNGGTHLPDITVVTPVFDDAGKEILFYSASRGHHADVGGTAPGSMTPLATTVDEEGVLIDNFRIVEPRPFPRGGAARRCSPTIPSPARNPHQNIADLKAQIAANEKGVAELRKMVAHFGLDVVEAYMGHVQDNAAESVRRVLERLPDKLDYEYPTDTGQVIKVKITVDREKREATVDFTGTSPVMKNNFNAPEPVARAAVLYAFRVMVEGSIPMNAGCLRPIDIIIPDGCMLKPPIRPPSWPAMSRPRSMSPTRIFGAMGALANAQGTMNNLTFGNMTVPVLRDDLLRFAGRPDEQWPRLRRHVRRPHPHDQFAPDRSGSSRNAFPRPARGFPHPRKLGRQGQVERPATAPGAPSVSSSGWNARSCPRIAIDPPRGLDGGGDGEVGKTEVRRNDGSIQTLKACDQTFLEAGEAVIVTTPTPGGFGRA